MRDFELRSSNHSDHDAVGKNHCPANLWLDSVFVRIDATRKVKGVGSLDS
jgi:hypothetical protein